MTTTESPETMDLLQVILDGTSTGLAAARGRVAGSAGRGDPEALARAERAVQRSMLPGSPEAITLDHNGFATIVTDDAQYCGGRFGTPTVAELTAAAQVTTAAAQQSAPVAPMLSVIEGTDPLTDIGALQAMTGQDTVFQVASQFNCLEAPAPTIVDVADYLNDPTQGPRAAVSAFPAALVRHYAAPDGDHRFRQTTDRQLDLLADALPAHLGRVRNGYLQTRNLTDTEAAAGALGEAAGLIRVGVHENAQVVLGANWDGGVTGTPQITQVCTSTLAMGAYGNPGEADSAAAQALCRHLLRAGYLATLLAATALGKRRVVLTLIGGGVFGNPHPLIMDSILWALDQCRSVGVAGLHVIVNARGLDPRIDRTWLADACTRTGGRYRALS